MSNKLRRVAQTFVVSQEFVLFLSMGNADFVEQMKRLLADCVFAGGKWQYAADGARFGTGRCEQKQYGFENVL